MTISRLGGVILAPSHFTRSMAARCLGVTPAAIRDRIKRGTLPTETHFGVKLVPSWAVMLALDKKEQAPKPLRKRPEFLALIAKGYTLLKKSKCRACGTPILWFLTAREKRMPFDLDSILPHWERCPKTHTKAPAGRPPKEEA